jgi:hypothetical protein
VVVVMMPVCHRRSFDPQNQPRQVTRIRRTSWVVEGLTRTSGRSVDVEAARLTELRRAAAEELMDAELACGHHDARTFAPLGAPVTVAEGTVVNRAPNSRGPKLVRAIRDAGSSRARTAANGISPAMTSSPSMDPSGDQPDHDQMCRHGDDQCRGRR